MRWGGALGGAAFDIVGMVVGTFIVAKQIAEQGQVPQYQEVGALPRALAAVCIGMAIGLFVGIVERVARKAWLRLELGRNEGREWTVDAAQTFIGRSENANVPLFGDPNVAPMHACIYRTPGGYRLVDGGTPIGIGVNGIRVPEAMLNNGDVVQIGSFNLRFLLKDARGHVPRPTDVARSPSPVAMPIDPTPAPMPLQVSTHALVALDGPLVGQKFSLQGQETVAGRESPHIRLDFDKSASRQHCAFQVGPSGVMVRDLGSTNGTIVNGARVQEMTLRPGDTVKIGSTTFRLEQ